jgi:hypothetical protein
VKLTKLNVLIGYDGVVNVENLQRVIKQAVGEALDREADAIVEVEEAQTIGVSLSQIEYAVQEGDPRAEPHESPEPAPESPGGPTLVK